MGKVLKPFAWNPPSKPYPEPDLHAKCLRKNSFSYLAVNKSQYFNGGRGMFAIVVISKTIENINDIF
jgi:hypothetical protein